MDLFKLFGDPADLAKRLVTQATAQFSKPIIIEALNERMNAAARVALGGKLIAAGQHLQKGEVAKSADVIADIIDDIRL